MEKECRKCKRLSKNDNAYCPYCGTPFKRKSHKVILVVFAFLASISLLLTGYIIISKKSGQNDSDYYFDEYVIPSVMEIYDGYSVKRNSTSVKSCSQSYGDGIGFSTRYVTIYRYDIEVRDDRYPDSVVVSSVYYDSYSKRVYNEDLAMKLSQHNIERYFFIEDDYDYSGVVVKEVYDVDQTDLTDICNYYRSNSSYEIHLHLDMPYDEYFTDEYSIMENIEENVIKCGYGWSQSGKGSTDCYASIKFFFVFNDGEIIEKEYP